MTINEFCKKINNRQYRKELTVEEEKLAKELGYVIIFGASDDLCEIRGAINDEIGAYKGTTIYFDKFGIVDNEIIKNCQDCRFLKQIIPTLKTINAIWCPKNTEKSWEYKTEIPHGTFNILEDTEIYCTGIIFDINLL